MYMDQKQRSEDQFSMSEPAMAVRGSGVQRKQVPVRDTLRTNPLNGQQARLGGGLARSEKPGTVQRERKAVLGRRFESYENDIRAFLSLPPNRQGRQNEECITSKLKTQRVGRRRVVVKTPDQPAGYEDSVNVLVKRKISESPGKADEYQKRVLNMTGWTIAANREWIRTGKAGGYDSNVDIKGNAVTGVDGTDGGSKFRLVGLEKIIDDGMAAEQEGAVITDKKGRSLQAYHLKIQNFTDAREKANYLDAFSNQQAADNENFIAKVVHSYTAKNILFEKARGGKTINGTWHPSYPTILAQEMEQIRESGKDYRFVKVSKSAGGGEKVVAMTTGDVEKMKSEEPSVQAPEEPVESAEPITE